VNDSSSERQFRAVTGENLCSNKQISKPPQKLSKNRHAKRFDDLYITKIPSRTIHEQYEFPQRQKST
jgi:hypothetical protein